MAEINQSSFGWFNNQKIETNNIIVDDSYLRSLLAFKNNPSDVNTVVLSLYNSTLQDDGTLAKRAVPPEVDSKIDYNNVVTYRELVNTNYSENGFFLDEAYEALDSDVPGRKRQFLRFVNGMYLATLGDYIKANPGVAKMDVIRNNADNIISKIINNLLLRIVSNPSGLENLSRESIEFNVIAIVCHAFVDCKVLENPNAQ